MSGKSLKRKIKELSRRNPETFDKLDRFRAFYFNGIALKPHEKEELNKMRFAITAYHEYPSKQQVVTFLMENYLLSESHSYAVLRDAIRLFGDVHKIDKKGEQIASYEFYMRLAKKADNAGEYETAMRCKERADKIIGLFEPDATPIRPEEMMSAAKFVFSSSAKVFKEMQNQQEGKKPIDIGHEDVQ